MTVHSNSSVRGKDATKTEWLGKEKDTELYISTILLSLESVFEASGLALNRRQRVVAETLQVKFSW